MGREVGEKAIRQMWREILQPKIEKPIYDPKKKDAVIFDIDGTLADMGNKRGPYDTSKYLLDDPKTEIIELLDQEIQAGKVILIVSGRNSDFRVDTQAWLQQHSIQYDNLFMRPSDQPNTNDALIKKEILEKEILPFYNVIRVYDDRNRVVQMWREHGLTCLQVADGAF